MDDTLYLERDYVRSGFLHVGALVERKLGVSGFSDVAWELFENGQRGDIFDRTLSRIGLSGSNCLVRELVEAYRNHRPDIALAADALECLRIFRPEYQLGLITDGPTASQENKASALQLDRWIDFQILTGRWGVGFYKPHPRSFLTMQEQTGTSGSECMYVADNPSKDFTAPIKLGWTTVRIRRDNGLHSQIASRDTELHYELKDLSGLKQILAMNSTL
jgi:putative hydrolase of the HAD superfamily